MNRVFKSLLFLGCSLLTFSNSIQLPEIYSYYNIRTPQENMTDCEIALELFAKSSSNFTLCTIRNSQPIRACQSCIDSYMDVVVSHNNILTSEVNGTKCKEKLINLDRLEIIETTFSNIKELWHRGYCDKCFVLAEGNATLSNETKTFFTYFEIAHKCISDHIKEDDYVSNKTEQICKDCMDKYLQLNSFYESLKGTSETMGICMDIVDSMNATRSFWSDVLNCCKLRRTPEFTFLCCTGIITALPVIFYLSAKLFCDAAPRINVRPQNQHSQPINCIATTSSEES